MALYCMLSVMTLREEILAALKPWEDRAQFNARDATTDVLAAIQEHEQRRIEER